MYALPAASTDIFLKISVFQFVLSNQLAKHKGKDWLFIETRLF